MNKSLNLTIGVLTLLLTGCQHSSVGMPDLDGFGVHNSTPTPIEAKRLLTRSTPCCQDFGKLPFQALEARQTLVKELDGTSPSYAFEDGKSFVAAFTLPEDASLDLEIASIASEHHVFAPEALLLDRKFQIVDRVPAEAFLYQPADIFNGERLQAVIRGLNTGSQQRYLVLYSPASEQQGSTTMLHPAKQFARGTQRVEPDIADPVAKHSALGVLTLYAQPSGNLTRQLQDNAVTANSHAIPVPEGAYNDEIRQAVARGDIAQALRLVEDAENRGSTTARNTFIEAVKEQ